MTTTLQEDVKRPRPAPIRSTELFSTDIREYGALVETCPDNKLFLDGRPLRINVTEPLSWKAPSIARPYCCYMNTVIFYVYPHIVGRSGGFVEWDRVDTLLSWDHDFLFDGRLYRCGGGRVIRRCKGWWMTHWARLRVENDQAETQRRTL